MCHLLEAVEELHDLSEERLPRIWGCTADTGIEMQLCQRCFQRKISCDAILILLCNACDLSAVNTAYTRFSRLLQSRASTLPQEGCRKVSRTNANCHPR
eukprot:6078162-Amphidinium_carterae.1